MTFLRAVIDRIHRLVDAFRDLGPGGKPLGIFLLFLMGVNGCGILVAGYWMIEPGEVLSQRGEPMVGEWDVNGAFIERLNWPAGSVAFIRRELCASRSGV